MDFIPPLPCPKDAPLQLAHNLDNHLGPTAQPHGHSPKPRRNASMPSTQKPSAAFWASAGTITSRTHQYLSVQDNPPLTTTIRKLRLTAFGHICRLQPGTQAIDILASTPPTSWRRPRGRPPLRWADQIIKDTQMSLSDAVIATQDRPSWRSLVRDATRPATQAT